jgi:rod shape-determining protein MreD
LLVDVLTAAPLGLHALCFVLVAGIAWRFSVQVRVFGLLQQGAVVLALVLVAVCVEYVLRWLTGAPPRGMWLGPVVGSAVAWLPVAFCLSRLQASIEVR